MDNTRIKLSYYGLSGWHSYINSTAFVENVVDVVLIVEEIELKILNVKRSYTSLF